MYFYISSIIGYYKYRNKKKFWVKVGVAKDVEKRFKEYNTVHPTLYPTFKIDLPKHICLNLEDAFKRYLNDKRIYESECYEISPSEALFFTTRCLSHMGLLIYDFIDSGIMTGNNNSRLYFLNSIYFGKRIPLFELTNTLYKNKKKGQRVNSILYYKKVKILDKSFEKKYFNEFDNSNIDPNIFDKNNIFLHFMNEFDNYMIRITNHINTLDKFFSTFNELTNFKMSISENLFDVLSNYYYFFENNKKIKKHFLLDIKFLDNKIKLTKDINRYQALSDLRKRKIIAFDYLYDRRGPAGRKIKSDPYQLKRDTYYYNTTLDASNIVRKKLIKY